MDLQPLVRKTRSYRRFDSRRRLRCADLRALVNLARLSASAGNLQPLKYILACTPRKNKLIFPCLAWAGYLSAWPGPAPAERPAGYIIMLGDSSLVPALPTGAAGDFGHDPGIAAQSIMLGAAARGWGGCIIGSIERQRLRRALGIPRRYAIVLVLALGYPAEKVSLQPVRAGRIKYWRDAHDHHHVPKRALREIILA